MADRKQRVVLNGQSSQWEVVAAGVLQGSVLGPLFFLVYINDLVDHINCDIRLLADDTSIFSVVKNASQTSDELKRDLEKACLWAWQWKMQFNANKTEEVIFSTKRLKPPHPPLHLGDEEVTRLTLCEMLLYGNPHLNIIDNRIILEATISFIESTKRLN